MIHHCGHFILFVNLLVSEGFTVIVTFSFNAKITNFQSVHLLLQAILTSEIKNLQIKVLNKPNIEILVIKNRLDSLKWYYLSGWCLVITRQISELLELRTILKPRTTSHIILLYPIMNHKKIWLPRIADGYILPKEDLEKWFIASSKCLNIFWRRQN